MPNNDPWSTPQPAEWAALSATLKEITPRSHTRFGDDVREHSEAALGVRLEPSDFGRTLRELQRWSPFSGRKPPFDGDVLMAYALDYLGRMFWKERRQEWNFWKLDRRCETMRNDFIGHHPAMMPLRYWLPHYVDHRISVMLIGERGTGKKTLVRLMGDQNRVFRTRRLVLSFPGTSVKDARKQLSEFFERHSELKGDRLLYLDGMHECPEEIQRTLLDLLLDVITPLGANDASVPQSSASVVQSRRLFLLSSMEPGHGHLILPELLERLSEVSMLVPPLNSLGADIVVLAENHATKVQRELRRRERTIRISDGAKPLLLKRTWRGNVRELFGVIRQAVIVHGSASGEINRRLLQRVIDVRDERSHRHSNASSDESLMRDITHDSPTLKELSYRYATRVARDADTKERAAEILDIHRNTLRRILRRRRPSSESARPTAPRRRGGSASASATVTEATD